LFAIFINQEKISAIRPQRAPNGGLNSQTRIDIRYYLALALRRVCTWESVSACRF
jgi:hypothetical protein